MQTHADGHWTWQQFLGWAFRDARLAELSGAIHDAALRARYLCDVPADDCVRTELNKNLAAIARQAERLQLDSHAGLARRLARALRAEQPDTDVLAQVREGCDALEHGVAELGTPAGADAQCQPAA
jgi:hypothetical protein